MAKLWRLTEDKIQEAIRLYTERGWSCSHIAEYFGCSHTNIWKHLKKRGVNTVKGTDAFWFDVECAVCGKKFKRTRSRFRNNYYHYCSRDCYSAMLQSGMTADPSYHGGILGESARWKAAKLYGADIPNGAVVHHENRDRTDNSADNLLIFKSQADHMRWHRGINVEPLWPNPIPKDHLAHPLTRTFKSIKEIPKPKSRSRYRDGCMNCGKEVSYTLYMLKKMGGFDCPDCGETIVNEF